MANGPRADMPSETKTDVPGKTSRANPLLRLGFFACFLLTLPFTWGETSSCNGPTTMYTGYEKLVLKPNAGEVLSIAVIFLSPIILGFVQYFVRVSWLRLAAEFGATMFSSFGTFYCFLSAIFSGDLVHNSRQTHPAPFVATFVMLAILVHAFRSTIHRMNEILIERRSTTLNKQSNREH
jgi:hypothetical protein